MSSPPTDEVLDRVYRRAHELRRRRRRRVAPVVAAVVLVLVVVPLVWTSRHDDASQVVTDDGSSQGAPPPASVIYGFGLPGSAGEPRPIVQMDAATMTVRTTYAVPQLPQTTIPASELPPGVDGPILRGGSAPERLRLSPDRSRLFFQIRGGSCGKAIYAVDVDDPTSMRPVLEPPEGSGIGDFTPISDDRLVWHRCPLDASSDGAIVTTDLGDGTESSMYYDTRWGWPSLAASPDGRTVAIGIYDTSSLTAEPEIKLVPLDEGASIADLSALPRTTGCRLTMPQFNRGDGELYVLEQCGAGPRQGGRLVAIDLSTGSITRTVVEIDDDAVLTGFAIDATGEHLLYSASKAVNPTGVVSEGGEPQTFRLDPGQSPLRLPLLPIAMPPGFLDGQNLVW